MTPLTLSTILLVAWLLLNVVYVNSYRWSYNRLIHAIPLTAGTFGSVAAPILIEQGDPRAWWVVGIAAVSWVLCFYLDDGRLPRLLWNKRYSKFEWGEWSFRKIVLLLGACFTTYLTILLWMQP